MTSQDELFPPDLSPLHQLLYLNNVCKDLDEQLMELELVVKDKNDRLRQYREQLMPQLMEDLGITEFVLSDGRKIILQEITSGAISEATKREAMEWLRQHNHDGIIKNTVAVSLPRGDDEMAQRVIHNLHASGVHNITHKQEVHYQTLQAFLREMAHTPNFPRELFKVHEVKRVIVK